jgi:DUF971 family protein
VKNLQPTAVELQPEQGMLQLSWSDGRQTRHSMAELRKLCPCATCRTEREKLQSQSSLRSLRVIKSEAPAVAQIVQVTPIGRYALNFVWNDGHQTGIYAYEFLLQHQE